MPLKSFERVMTTIGNYVGGRWRDGVDDVPQAARQDLDRLSDAIRRTYQHRRLEDMNYGVKATAPNGAIVCEIGALVRQMGARDGLTNKVKRGDGFRVEPSRSFPILKFLIPCPCMHHTDMLSIFRSIFCIT